MSFAAGAVVITDAEHEGRPQFKVVTAGATWFYDKAGGGFSRLLDRDGVDWVSFKKEPLKEVPASAAAGFRGIPNLVHGAGNPDAGAGHPGFEQCESKLAAPDTIRTTSRSGRWAWSWTFTGTHATFTMEKADPEHGWWFLYEGTVGGRWSPQTHYWGTDLGGPRRDTPDSKNQHFGRWRWAYFGDDAAPRVLLVAQAEADTLPDTLWYMGSTAEGLRAPDGMVVFGFGRGPRGSHEFRGAGQRFALGFVEGAVQDAAAHDRVASTAAGWLDAAGTQAAAPRALVPEIASGWWRVCVMPDLGALRGPDAKKQHIVDHSFLRQPDGKWILWACMRGTAPGRILYGWEGGSLVDGPWTPLGVVARAEKSWGEKFEPAESIQAPHFVQAGGAFHCFYNSAGIRLMTSRDGKNFTRAGQPPDGNLLYADGGRDVMVLPLDGVFHAYSTVSTADGRGYIALRTSRDLKAWTPLKVVCEGGRGGTGPVSAESPFVVARDGFFYLFRASSNDGMTCIYRSRTPDYFGVNDDANLIATMKVKAPEIIRQGDEWFISDLADFQGIKLARLAWTPAANP